jgi:enoyl ACP reductase
MTTDSNHLLDGKHLLITGVATTDSIAFATAAAAQRGGADVVLGVFPRDLERATEAAATLPVMPPILELDLTDKAHIEVMRSWVSTHWGGLDGALHAVAFAPRNALAGRFTDTPMSDIALAFETSTYSYATLAALLADLAPETGGSLVGLDFDADRAWPIYNWMGVCKAALEAANRYVARDLGSRRIRANLVAAGPLNTRAAGGIPGFDLLLEAWERAAPMGWDPADADAVADAICFLLSDLARMVTGEILHVDGGYHAMAAPLAPPGHPVTPPG